MIDSAEDEDLAVQVGVRPGSGRDDETTLAIHVDIKGTPAPDTSPIALISLVGTDPLLHLAKLAGPLRRRPQRQAAFVVLGEMGALRELDSEAHREREATFVIE
jgi:hypothetical protein